MNHNSLSCTYYHQVMVELGENIPQKELEILFTEMDTDHSGTIGYDEFVEGMAKHISRYSSCLISDK